MSRLELWSCVPSRQIRLKSSTIPAELCKEGSLFKVFPGTEPSTWDDFKQGCNPIIWYKCLPELDLYDVSCICNDWVESKVGSSASLSRFSFFYCRRTRQSCIPHRPCGIRFNQTCNQNRWLVQSNVEGPLKSRCVQGSDLEHHSDQINYQSCRKWLKSTWGDVVETRHRGEGAACACPCFWSNWLLLSAKLSLGEWYGAICWTKVGTAATEALVFGRGRCGIVMYGGTFYTGSVLKLKRRLGAHFHKSVDGHFENPSSKVNSSPEKLSH